MSRMKKVISIMLVVAMVMGMSITSFAGEVHNESCNVSTEKPREPIAVFGLGKPSKDSVINLKDEELTFAGEAERSILYTNKHFTGKSTIKYSIKNNCNKKLTVKFYTSSGWFKSKKIEVEANATLSGTISELDSSKLYYLTFSAPSDFSGKVY